MYTILYAPDRKRCLNLIHLIKIFSKLIVITDDFCTINCLRYIIFSTVQLATVVMLCTLLLASSRIPFISMLIQCTVQINDTYYGCSLSVLRFEANIIHDSSFCNPLFQYWPHSHTIFQENKNRNRVKQKD